MNETEAAQQAILKVGEFIRQTGKEVEDVKNACRELTLAILAMNKTLKKIELRVTDAKNKTRSE